MRALVPLSVALATALRLWILAAGPDTDTDAYGHAMAGRWMLLDPTDVRVHWVWLPLWHAVHGVIAALGGALDDARALNVALSAAPPLLLARLLRRTGDEALAALAGALLALWPLGLGLGQSGQPEALFLLLTLGACVAWEEGRPGLTGALLGAAALCRYEAWVLPPVYLALWWRGRARERGNGRAWLRGALGWLLPGVAIAGWCLVHALVTREFLLFLRENRQFARDASQRLGFPWGPEPRPLLMALWYPVILPADQLRPFAPFAALGAVAAWRRRNEPLLAGALLWPAAVVLTFLSYGWVMRLNLGLHRHLFALSPLYATLAAIGLVASARWAEARWPRARRWPLLPLAAALFAATRTLPVARWNQTQHAAAFAEARASAAALRAAGLGPADRIVCDLSSVEQIGRLPARQMLRRAAGSLTPSGAATLAASLPAGGKLYVVAHPRDTAALRPAARVLHESASEVVLVLAAKEPVGSPP